jgi:hypothetical protein
MTHTPEELRRLAEAAPKHWVPAMLAGAERMAAIRNFYAAARTAVPELLDALEAAHMESAKLRQAHRWITTLGGNLSDDRHTDATGPNDARQRGLMYCEARRIAREALETP